MFFSNDLLTKRHGSGWSLYWVAAVSANFKSAITRISKKELLNANLPEACSTLTQPPEPLALRLSSALLLGIVRVYGHKCSALHLQVQHVAQSIKNTANLLTEDINVIASLHNSRSRSTRSKIDLEEATHLNTGANLHKIDGDVRSRRDQEHIRELFEFEEPDPFLFDPKFHEGAAEDLYLGFGAILVGDKSTRISLSSSRADSSPRQHDPFVSKPSEISLSGHSLILGQLSNPTDDSNRLNEYLGPALGFDDLGGEGEGIDLGIIPEASVDPMAGLGRIRKPSSRFGIESEVGRGEQGRRRHTSILGFNMSPVGIKRAQENVRESRPPEGPEDLFEFEPTSQFINPQLSLQDEEERLDHLRPESLEKVISLKRKDESHPRLDRRKFVKVLLDPVTCLSAENVMSMRDHYREERLKRESKYQDRRQHQILQARANELVYGIPFYFQASNLRELWDGCVKVPEVDMLAKNAVERPGEEHQDGGRDMGFELNSSDSGQADNRHIAPQHGFQGSNGMMSHSTIHLITFHGPTSNRFEIQDAGHHYSPSLESLREFHLRLSRRVEQIKQLETDPDALNFLAWSQSRIDNPSDFFIQRSCTGGEYEWSIAAQAFIKVLSLASHDLIKVIEQDEAYAQQNARLPAGKMNINKKDTNEASANLSRTVRFKGHEQLPYRLILSLLSHKPIRIDDIRPDDQEPGLNEAEVSFLRLIEKLTNGTTVEISYTGTSLLFVPGTLTGGHITHQTPLSSSIGYFLTPILAIAPFCKHDLTLVLKGITTSNDSLSVDVLRVSGLPTLGIWLGENAGKLELKISKRGHPQKEAANAASSVLRHSVRVSPQLSNRLVASARSVLNRYIPDIYIYTDVYRGAESGKSPGYGLTLLGTSTTTALYTAEAVSYPASTPEDIGILASRRLLKQISRGGCIDQGFEWLGLLFLLLSHQTDIGRIKIGGPFTEALVAWIRDLKKVFGVQFKITTVERQTIPEALEDDDEDSGDEEAEGEDHNKAVIKQKTIDLLPCEYVVSAVGLGWINTAKSAK
ncbi:hypothetical protein H4Q26_012040 [Puccinia striiformis f. sp. tritici PST-130]|nr:hypothetical protein H4Q26_012040 [Puccinia striiformis f. sp. tritici PST-130]